MFDHQQLRSINELLLALQAVLFPFRVFKHFHSLLQFLCVLIEALLTQHIALLFQVKDLARVVDHCLVMFLLNLLPESLKLILMALFEFYFEQRCFVLEVGDDDRVPLMDELLDLSLVSLLQCPHLGLMLLKQLFPPPLFFKDPQLL